MSKRINNAPQNYVMTMLKRMEQALNGLKTPQPIGGDILSVQSLPSAGTFDLVGPITLNAGGGFGDYYVITFESIPNNQTLTLWNFAWSLYVDPPTFEANGLPAPISQWALGGGTSIPGNNYIQIVPWLDWATSSDTLNTRNYCIYMHNSDTVSHDVYVAFKSYFPNLEQS